MREIGSARVTAVVPTRGLIFAQTIESLHLNGVDGFLTIEGLPIPDAQNVAVLEALQTDCTHVFMVEDDMAFPEGTLEAMLGVDADVVCVDYPVENGYSTIKRVGAEIAHSGLGCTLVKREVFTTMEAPWFECDKSINTDGTVVDTPYKYGGQDIWFGRKVREAGFTIKQLEGYEATHLRCKQLERIEYNKGTYQITELAPVSRRQEE